MLTRSLVVLGIVALAACEPETAGGVAEGGKSGTGASGGTSGTGGTGGTSGTGGSVGGNAGSTGGGAGRAGSGGSAGATAPSVSFVSPADGATLENPVTFVIAAVGADEVEVFADETYSLGPAWDPSKKSELRYRFGGTGFPRPIHVSARKDGAEVARDDISITIEPDPCEVQFFLKKFDENNSGSDLFEPREQTLAAVQAEVASLQACGAAVTLGGMMSLLLYEGAFRLGAYNTLCEENSYNQTTTNCDADPEALYSYQFGLGAIHTSNFHPCKGGAWTQSMRTLLEDELEKSGFSVASSLLTADDKARFAQICPGVTPSGIDHFILAAHAAYGIPKDAKGNLIEQFGKFPLFDAATSIRLSLNPIRAQCSSIDSDGEAIAVWGGGDPSYSDPAKQQQVLAYFQNFAATCN